MRRSCGKKQEESEKTQQGREEIIERHKGRVLLFLARNIQYNQLLLFTITLVPMTTVLDSDACNSNNTHLLIIGWKSDMACETE